MNYFMALMMIGVAILVHEFGHFIAAKIVKIPIKIFSIGFGPKLWSKRIGPTEYKLSVIPLGGYVLPAFEDENEFFSIPAFKRIVMAAGGPLASIVLPVFCFMITNIVSSGLSFESVFILPVVQLIKAFYGIVVSLLSLSGTEQLSGIVGIVAQGGGFIQGDILNGIKFLGLISINLALLNLLPIPVLDGGKILLYCLEKVHVKFLRLHYPLAVGGWIFVLGLMLYVSVLDVYRMVA